MINLPDISLHKIMLGFTLTIMFSCNEVGVDPTPIVNCNTTGPVLFLNAPNNECGSNGSIEVMVNGGVGNLSLSLSPDPGVVFNNGVYVDLPPDTYTITVTDDNSCSNSALIALGITSYAEIIVPIISSSCILPTCHDGSNSSVTNWSVLSNIQGKASEIKNRTGNRSMPPDSQPPLDQKEIELIACWLDLGAKDN